MKLKKNEKKFIIGSVLFMIFVYLRAIKISLYIGDTADYIISTLLLIVVLQMILPYSKIISNTKSLFCKSFK